MTKTTASTGTSATCTCGERLIVASGLGQRSNTWEHADALVDCQTPAPSDGLVDVVVVVCGCGFLPLNSHLTSGAAWQFAADHVALNPSLCTPDMHRDRVPAALAPKV